MFNNADTNKITITKNLKGEKQREIDGVLTDFLGEVSRTKENVPMRAICCDTRLNKGK